MDELNKVADNLGENINKLKNLISKEMVKVDENLKILDEPKDGCYADTVGSKHLCEAYVVGDCLCDKRDKYENARSISKDDLIQEQSEVIDKLENLLKATAAAGKKFMDELDELKSNP